MKQLIKREEKGKVTTENYVTDNVRTFAYNVSLMSKLAAKAAIENEIVSWQDYGFTYSVRVVHDNQEVETYLLNTGNMTFVHKVETKNFIMIENLKFNK